MTEGWTWQAVLGIALIIGVFVYAFGELGWGGGDPKKSGGKDSTGPF